MAHAQYHTSTHAIARRILADSRTGLCFHVCDHLYANGDLPLHEVRSRAALAFALLAEVYPEQAAFCSKDQSKFVLYNLTRLLIAIGNEVYPEFSHREDAKAYIRLKLAERWLCAPDRRVVLHLSPV